MRARWIFAVLLVATGCFDSGSEPEPTCRPSCRDGFTCYYGTCISICNPPCGVGTRCVALDAYRGTCVVDTADASVSDAPVTDAPASTPDVLPGDGGFEDAPGDVPDAPAPDVVARDADAVDAPAQDAPPEDVADATTDRPAMDATSLDAGATDAGVTDVNVTDAGATDVPRDGGSPCGRAGERCCAGVSCLPGALCVSERCVAYTSGPGECLSKRDCAGDLACVGGVSCGTNPDWRWCYQCRANPGVARLGERCTSYADCATGVCSSGRCTYACDPGPAGDSQCAGLGVRNGRCTEVVYGLTPIADGGVPRAWQVLGECDVGCTRNSDCASGTYCIPLSGDLLDRVTFVCGTTRATAVAGTPCRWGDDCQSGMCISGANPAGGAACSAPCEVDGDCPGTAPSCTPIRLYTASGTPVQVRGCLPRRM